MLGNDLIDVDRVMAPFAREVLGRAAQGGGAVVLAIDQSQANAGHQMLMVSLRFGGRALPLAWRLPTNSRRSPTRDRTTARA